MKNQSKHYVIFLMSIGFLTFAYSNAMSQDKYAPLSLASSFLLITPDARSSGMGDANVALSNDVSSVYWNPAGLGFQQGFQTMVTHNKWMPTLGLSDMMIENVMASYGLKEVGGIGTLGFGMTFFNQGMNTYTNSNGVELASYLSYELSFWFGYGIEVIPGLSLGLNARFIASALMPNWVANGSGTGYSGSADIALLWKPILPDWMKDRLNIGLNISNIGPKMNFNSAVSAEAIPTNLKLGFAFFPIMIDMHLLVVTVDFNRIIATKRITTTSGTAVYTSDDVFTAFATTWTAYGLKAVNVSFGLEYWFGNPKIFGLRSGFYYEDYAFRNRSPYVTFGASVRYSLFGLDFSYILGTTSDNPYNSTFRVSISMSLDALVKKKTDDKVSLVIK